MIKPKKNPQRLCSGCQNFQDKKALVRVVRAPAGEVAIDPSGKAQGRGGYVCRKAECINKAAACKGLDRALKTAVPSAVYDALKALSDKS